MMMMMLMMIMILFMIMTMITFDNNTNKSHVCIAPHTRLLLKSFTLLDSIAYLHMFRSMESILDALSTPSQLG